MPRPQKERIGNEEELGHEIASLLKATHDLEIISVHAQTGRISIESLPSGRAGERSFRALELSLLQLRGVMVVSAFLNVWNHEEKRIQTTHRFVFAGPDLIQEQDKILSLLRPVVKEQRVDLALPIDATKYKENYGGAPSR